MVAKSPYDDLIMDHIKNARNYRVLDDADRRSHGSNPLCGDEVDVFLKVDSECIADAAFQCECCGISMASASMMTESIKGRSAAEVHNQARALIALINARADPATNPDDAVQSALLATVQEFPARARCAALPWITLEAALANRPEAVFVP
ncbi:MAG TPA: SUF system NifU family Fe-S cluster assembly protein [Burkholderiales bacterium]|nr:SUF system NifU family Fe-S cluster assembly protein [Burkholderiales bacterium]